PALVHERVGVVGGVVVGLAASAHGQMRVVDARVDDGDRGPFAGQAQGVGFGGSGAGADPGDAGLVQQVVAGDGRHRLHALGGADGRDVAGAHDGADAVGADHHAGPLLDDEVADLGEDLTLLGPHGQSLGALGRAAGVGGGGELRHRRLVELDEDLDLFI